MTRHLAINKKGFSSNRSLIYHNGREIMLIYWISNGRKKNIRKKSCNNLIMTNRKELLIRVEIIFNIALNVILEN